MKSPSDSSSVRTPTNKETRISSKSPPLFIPAPSSAESPSQADSVPPNLSGLFDHVPASDSEDPQFTEEWDTDEDADLEIDGQPIVRVMMRITRPSGRGSSLSTSPFPSLSRVDSLSVGPEVFIEHVVDPDSDLEYPYFTEEWDTDEDADLEIDGQPIVRVMMRIARPSGQGPSSTGSLPSLPQVESLSLGPEALIDQVHFDSDLEYPPFTEEWNTDEETNLETGGEPTVRVMMEICPSRFPEPPPRSAVKDSVSTAEVSFHAGSESEPENDSMDMKDLNHPSPLGPVVSVRGGFSDQTANEDPPVDKNHPASIETAPVAEEKAMSVSHPHVSYTDYRADEVLSQPSDSCIAGDAVAQELIPSQTNLSERLPENHGQGLPTQDPVDRPASPTPNFSSHRFRSERDVYFIIGPDSPDSSPDDIQDSPVLPQDETTISEKHCYKLDISAASSNFSLVSPVPVGLGISIVEVQDSSDSSPDCSRDIPRFLSVESEIFKEQFHKPDTPAASSPAASSNYNSQKSLASSGLGVSIRDVSNPNPLTAEDFAINRRNFFQKESSNASENLSPLNGKHLHPDTPAASSPAASSNYSSQKSLASIELGGSIRDVSNPDPFTAEDFAINRRDFFQKESSNASEDLSPLNGKHLHSDSPTDLENLIDLANLPRPSPEHDPAPSPARSAAAEFFSSFTNADPCKTRSRTPRCNTPPPTLEAAEYLAAFSRAMVIRNIED